MLVVWTLQLISQGHVLNVDNSLCLTETNIKTWPSIYAHTLLSSDSSFNNPL